jgi:hypothetical protein
MTGQSNISRKPVNTVLQQSDAAESLKLPRSTTYIVENPTITKSQANNNNKSIRENTQMIKSYLPKKTPPGSGSNEESLNESLGNNSRKAVSLAAFKQQKRSEIMKLGANKNKPGDVLGADHDDASDVILSNHKSIEFILKNARKTGQINLSNYGLTEGK